MRPFLFSEKSAGLFLAACMALSAGIAAAQPPGTPPGLPPGARPVAPPGSNPGAPPGAQPSALPNANPAQGADAPPAADAKLIEAGHGVMMKYCYRCHGSPDQKYPGLDMGNRKLLMRPAKEDEEPFIVPGKPDASRLWEQIDLGAMPPDDQPQISDEEKEAFRAWLAAGGQFPLPVRVARDFLGDDTILGFISLDLQQMQAEDRQFVRYFSMAHLWNDPDVSEEMLRVQGAAVSKLINSLSFKSQITPPRRVDPQGTILAIDLRDYGWDERGQWSMLLKLYPYGLQRRSREADLVYEMTSCDLPYVRADWFVNAAARPPLYHDLLGLPNDAARLEKQLGVDVAANYRKGRLWRAGFAKSGVSRQNRMVERHESPFGAYWKSYDFESNTGEANLFQFPLGPVDVDPSSRRAFTHGGGEMIFNLPNGMQAYLLVANTKRKEPKEGRLFEERRIDEGPIPIVSDAQQFAGTPAVVNGISCMGCHKHGMITFTDEIRGAFAMSQASPVSQQVLRLYPEPKQFDALVQSDRERFLTAVQRACRPWYEGLEPKADFSKLPDPVTRASMAYDVALTVSDLAHELGLPEGAAQAQALGVVKADEFATAIRVSERLRSDLSLAPVALGGTLPRDAWEQVFQRVARELRLGVPVKFN